MNSVRRTIATEMARPLPARLCVRGCGLTIHHGNCKGEDRFAAEDGIRKCARPTCGRKLALSNPGPFCRPCQTKVLQEGIAQREQLAIGAELLDKDRQANDRYPPDRGRVGRPPGKLANTQPQQPAPGGVRTIRLDAIPMSAENRLESEMGELYARLIALPKDEALVIPREDKRQIRNTCERLRNRLKNANAGKLRWKRDGLTLYAWRELA